MAKQILIVSLVYLLLTVTAYAACDMQGLGSDDYQKAETKVYSLPEVMAWKTLVYKNKDRKVITIPSMDQQLMINDRCYWSVTLYEDTPTHSTRWNTFYVKTDKQAILVDGITGGDPMTLKQWRKRNKTLESSHHKR